MMGRTARIPHRLSNQMSVLAMSAQGRIEHPGNGCCGPNHAQVFFCRPTSRKQESNDRSQLRISDQSASLNDPDTPRKSGFKLLTCGESRERLETVAASGVTPH